MKAALHSPFCSPLSSVMSRRPRLVCLLRPNGHSLWVPEPVAYAMNVQSGSRLTSEQMEHPDLLSYLERVTMKGGSR